MKLLKPVFDYGYAVCEICDTPLGGDNIYWLGTHAYCAEHYEKENYEEKYDKKVLEKQRETFKKITIAGSE